MYAISPGLDIVFSCAADVAALKRKMKQVYNFISIWYGNWGGDGQVWLPPTLVKKSQIYGPLE